MNEQRSTVRGDRSEIHMATATTDVAAPTESPSTQTDAAKISSETGTTTNKQPTSKYVRDFESLFVPIRVELLRNKAQSGQLRHCQFRSLCWRYFLNCLPEQYSDWPATCQRKRRDYESIKRKHLSSVKQNITTSDRKSSNDKQSDTKHQSDESTIKSACDQAKDPNDVILNKPKDSSKIERDNESPKQENDDEHEYTKLSNNCDYKDLFRTIERDVVRTFPEMEFFRQTEMQDILINILFVFASENPRLSYKQGMHELLATLLYVAHTDSQNCLINFEGGYANDLLDTLLGLKYLEHDVYYLFSSLMKSIETWYQNDELLVMPDPPKTITCSTSNSQLKSQNDLIKRFSSTRVSGLTSTSSTSTSKLVTTKQQLTSVLSLKLKKISENIVRSYDSELFYHLEALQIAPQIYGIRWMRLLFGREFEFLDLLTVWDAIICDQDLMSLVDYVFASMLITIREELVNGDYTHCLNNLMRYQFKDVVYVIKLALYLRDPINYSRPKKHNLRPIAPHPRYQQYPPHQHRQPPQQSRQQQSTPASNKARAFRIPMIREFEMREMESTSNAASSSSTSMSSKARTNLRSSFSSNDLKNRFPKGKIGNTGSPQNTFDISTESYDDLHSIVDYCWRLLSEQIDSLQRCLPKEKGLHSEDEIFVALAQLKKVRDVLKGSLKLEDELEITSAQASGSK